MTIKVSNFLKDKLREVFGYHQFRGNQETIIKNLMDGNNTFVIMPTGAGKSMCYQLPAVINDGTAIIISPLIALMKNQVDQMTTASVDARFLNSTLNKTETNRVKEDIRLGKVKMLYVAPESLVKEENLSFLKTVKLSFVAIDEAHCISEWGHDFRPEYRKIKSVVEELGNLPVIALTATATPKVQQDIVRNLQMEDAHIFQSSFNRTNLFYEVKQKIDPQKQLIRFIKKHKNKSGIVYCLSRKTVEKVSKLLEINNIKSLPYHAGLDTNRRMNNQDAFLNEDVDVIVATIAFGMGIDKPDVRFVVHYDVPKSIEGYYQETGRAGRDGLEGNCLMLYDYNDILKLEKFNKDKPVTERDNARYLLQEMTDYAESTVCRRRQLLNYFGESYTVDKCTKCDNCTNEHQVYEGTKDLKLGLETVIATKERFRINHLVDVLLGRSNDYILSYEHNILPMYGKGKREDADAKYWYSLFRQAYLYEFIHKDVENYGVMHISEKGHEFIKNPFSIFLTKDHDYENIVYEDHDDHEVNTATAHDAVLFELLRQLRKKIAKEKKLPPYVIFQDPSLEEIATLYPTNEEDLAQINGVGMGKVRKFGQPFLTLINNYVKDNDIETASDVIVKTTVNKSRTKIFIIQQIDRKVDLEEIAEAKKLSFDELIDEIEHICFSGTRLNLDYYLEQILEDEQQDELYNYFMNAETDNIQVAMAAFDEFYTEDDLRLMRVKFFSEVAN